jgi:hypothetical protein
MGVPIICLLIAAVPNWWLVRKRVTFYPALLISAVPFVHALQDVFQESRAGFLREDTGISLTFRVLTALLPSALIQAFRVYRSIGRAGYF